MNPEAHYEPHKNYTLPERTLFNSKRVMFVICLLISAAIVIIAGSNI